MNNIATNIVFAFILSIILVFFGQLFILSPIDRQLEEARTSLSQLQENQKAFSKQKEDLLKEIDEGKNQTLLFPEEEGQILGMFLNKKSCKGFKINSYEMFSSYFYKPEQNDNEDKYLENTESQLNNADSNLYVLGADGMPITSKNELDNEEWPGVEITPVKITFTARTSDFVNNTMRYFWNIPAHGIRAADFIFKNEIIKGTLFFTFPLNEKNN